MARHEGDVIYFDKIRDLDVQANAAEVCIENYVRIKSLEKIIKDTEKNTRKPKERQRQESGQDYITSERDYIKYKKGTTIFDVFPFRKEETKEDLLKSFKRIAIYGTSYRMRCEGERGDYIELVINNNGDLIGKYVFTDYGEPSKEAKPITFNALTEGVLPNHPGNIYEYFRPKAVYGLIDNLRDDMDATKLAIQNAETNYGRTTFIVEKGFLEALTGRRFKEASKSEIEE